MDKTLNSLSLLVMSKIKPRLSLTMKLQPVVVSTSKYKHWLKLVQSRRMSASHMQCLSVLLWKGSNTLQFVKWSLPIQFLFLLKSSLMGKSEVLSIAPLLAQAILRVHRQRSVSQVFRDQHLDFAV